MDAARPMTELVFVRHASTSWSGHRYCGRADPPLNRPGRLIAGRLATELSASVTPGFARAGRIISSPARRARQTAAAIARAIPGLLVEIDERWAEADFGLADGLTFEELAAIEPGLAERLALGETAIDWPGGESASSLTERVRSALQDLEDDPAPTVVVSHAGPLRIAIALATATPIEDVAFLEPGEVLGGSRMLRFRA